MPVEVTCATCGKTKMVHPSDVKERNYCNLNCRNSDFVFISKLNAALRQRWANYDRPAKPIRVKADPEITYAKKSAASKASWGDPRSRAKRVAAIKKQASEPDARAKRSAATKAVMSCPKRRATSSMTAKIRLSDPDALAAFLLASRTPEIIAKRIAATSGENHWNWQGGATDDRSIWEQAGGHDWKRRCRARDRYTCRLCGVVKSSRSKGLHVHHIAPFATYPDLRSLDDNGATICNTCHTWLHSTDGEPWRAAWEAELLDTLTDPELETAEAGAPLGPNEDPWAEAERLIGHVATDGLVTFYDDDAKTIIELARTPSTNVEGHLGTMIPAHAIDRYKLHLEQLGKTVELKPEPFYGWRPWRPDGRLERMVKLYRRAGERRWYEHGHRSTVVALYEAIRKLTRGFSSSDMLLLNLAAGYQV